jgi:NAD(P)-dependent dehydrogenase (short-subunit alcohol dehydrogenase family)
MTPSQFPDPIPKLDGLSAIVTGATSGLGRETARALGIAGAAVTLGVRDRARGEAVASALGEELGGGSFKVEEVDVADFASVRAFARRLNEQVERVDILVHNAGIMATPRSITRDGVEAQMATNHLGPFLLTAVLLPCLLRAPQPRVVTVTSDEAEKVKLEHASADDLREPKGLSPWAWYGVTKLVALAFSVELQTRALAAGLPLLSTAAHPGLASTRLSSHVDGSLMRVGVMVAMALFGQSARGGARSLVHASVGADVHGGDLWGPGGLAGLRGKPVSKPLPKPATDTRLRSEIWASSEALTGVELSLSPRALAS